MAGAGGSAPLAALSSGDGSSCVPLFFFGGGGSALAFMGKLAALATPVIADSRLRTATAVCSPLSCIGERFFPSGRGTVAGPGLGASGDLGLALRLERYWTKMSPTIAANTT